MGYSYDYDSAGNRTVAVIDTLVNGEILNNLNQLKMQQGGTGMLPIRGTINVPGWVFVNGNYAPSRPDNSFEGRAAVTPGDNLVTVEATDVNGNTTTNQYSVTVTGSGSKTLVYDANGNLTSDGTRTFELDPLNRLTAVSIGTHRTEFTYNGLSQRVKIVEKENGNVTSTKQFVWIPGGAQPCEERDASNNVTKRFYPEGEQIGSTNYYYTRDHLGSVREMTDGTGAIHARYDYDPYGRLTKVQGDLDSDFSYAGYCNHSPSGLYATLNRFCDPDLARWISRDPAAEAAGVNLYGYVANDPINLWDPYGLDAQINVYRIGLTSPASVSVYENGNYLGSFFANTGGFLPNSHPPPDGTYTLRPRTNYEPGERFLNGTPLVTGLDFVHPEGVSKGCLTVPYEWANRIWDIMDRNLNNGGTRITYETNDWPKAIPAANPSLAPPRDHSWPIFNHQGIEAVPAWPVGLGPGTPGYTHD